MPTLSISNFSCIKNAELDISPVNVIIGPQGSGKSVTTKLLYFFTDIISNFTVSAERGDTIEQYRSHLEKQFSIWFPASAWGMDRFKINYTAGPFEVRLMRRMSQGRLSDTVRIRFSEWFQNSYELGREEFSRSRDEFEQELDNDPHVVIAIDRAVRTRELIEFRVGRDLREQYIGQQTFIPAGRSFFTTIGRLVAGFEQAGSLDPVTIKFARLFASLKDRNARRGGTARISRLGPDYLERRTRFMNNLFGGELKFEEDIEYVKATDGRKIPFSSLSSGQQELLPMWSLVDYFNELDALRKPPRNSSPRWRGDLVYIEEPEAHLFPSAQSMLMEFLIGSITSERLPEAQRSLVLTTHSPYIMAKLNVFLKAGQLSKRKKRNLEIGTIVPRECWITDTQLSAFAIENGNLRSLMDEEGFIDATYLDQISEDISREYSQLLRIESEVSML